VPTCQEIQTCIDNLTSSSDIAEMVILAAQTNDVSVNRSIPVAETCDLPDLATTNISVGTVFFVQSLCIPVVAGVGSWYGMDNRVLRQDYAAGELWSWGCNNAGQLGDNTTTNKSSPVSVVGGYTDWCQVSGSSIGDATVAVRTNGTSWTWGCNNTGQLGDGTTVNKSSPVSVVGGFTDWCQISASTFHSLAVRQNGTAWAWGCGANGRLGDNTSVNKSSPVSVVGGFTDWFQIAGGDHSLGLRQNGTIWGWGPNVAGRLGDGTTLLKSSPVSVVGGFTDWCQVSASDDASLALRQNGTAWAWGCNNCGQLGDGTTVSKSSPVSVVGGFTDWCQITAGDQHTLGVRQNGTAWAWGRGACGLLGDNTIVSKSSPVSVVGGFTDWCQVSAGNQHSMGIRTNSTLWAIGGNNSRGSLGDGTVTDRSSPVSVVGGFTDWCQVSAGNFFTFGIRKY
jgi:alpha-tubulin suppressor-like RCC1 family protein